MTTLTIHHNAAAMLDALRQQTLAVKEINRYDYAFGRTVVNGVQIEVTVLDYDVVYEFQNDVHYAITDSYRQAVQLAAYALQLAA